MNRRAFLGAVGAAVVVAATGTAEAAEPRVCIRAGGGRTGKTVRGATEVVIDDDFRVERYRAELLRLPSYTPDEVERAATELRRQLAWAKARRDMFVGGYVELDGRRVPITYGSYGVWT